MMAALTVLFSLFVMVSSSYGNRTVEIMVSFTASLQKGDIIAHNTFSYSLNIPRDEKMIMSS